MKAKVSIEHTSHEGVVEIAWQEPEENCQEEYDFHTYLSIARALTCEYYDFDGYYDSHAVITSDSLPPADQIVGMSVQHISLTCYKIRVL